MNDKPVGDILHDEEGLSDGISAGDKIESAEVDAVEKNEQVLGKIKSLSTLLKNEKLENLVISDLDESERSSALLILVSKRLFTAFSILIAIGLLLVWTLIKMKSGNNITLLIVLFCGVLGGFVGIQRRLKDLTIKDLEILSLSKVYLCLSPLVGGVLAFILYILFLSDLLSGELFPTFTVAETAKTPEQISKLGFSSILHQYATEGFKDYGKLIFWCFVAGFSERFVTDVIGKFDGKAVKSIK